MSNNSYIQCTGKSSQSLDKLLGSGAAVWEEEKIKPETKWLHGGQPQERTHTDLPVSPDGELDWGRLTGVELFAPGCFCSLSGLVLSCGVVLVRLSWRASTPFSTVEALLFCNSSSSSSSPSPDTPDDEGLDVWAIPRSSWVLPGVTNPEPLLFKFISLGVAPFSAASLSITSDAISFSGCSRTGAGQRETVPQ